MTAPANATKPEHTIYGPDADLFIQQPQPFSGPFNKPDEDRFVFHIPTGSKPNVVSPPIFLKTAIADLIRDNWAQVAHQGLTAAGQSADRKRSLG